MNALKKISQKIWKWRYRNYAFVTLLFLLWVIFMAPNNLGTQYKLAKELRDLRSMKLYYEKEIQENEKEICLFNTNLQYVETYGREEYLMKRDNEDIFLFIKEKSKK
ncbi:MAG: hypothetical protein RRX93_00550 [Bacteroidales bacterium]